MKTLETERLILRNWKQSDLDDFFEYASVDGVGEMAGWPHHENKETSQDILNSFIKNDDVYALELKDSGKVIGSLGIHKTDNISSEFDGKKQREIGYVLSKDYWGNGLIPEAVKRVLQYCFEDMGVDIVWCGHFTHNSRSQRVIEKSGFTFYKMSIYNAAALNRKFEDKLYILTKEDYEKNKK